MASRVELQFRRNARDLLPRGATVLAAVSGGSDSVALLELLLRYARGAGLRIVVAHLDHGLRRESARDSRFVERMAAQAGLRCVCGRRRVDARRAPDESPEEAARRVRRQFLLETASAIGADVIATGHTLDDQAETVLMRLMRGAGPSALAGMSPSGPGPFVRPLLAMEREALRAYLHAGSIPFLEDPSNDDLRFVRNRVRRVVLPLLRESLNPAAARHLVEAAARLREDAEYLDALARTEIDGVARRVRGVLVLPAAVLRDAAPPLARRMARMALERAGVDPRRIGARHIHAVLDIAAAHEAKSLDLPGGVTARCHRSVLKLQGPTKTAVRRRVPASSG